MNVITANTLLKTLEEPPGEVKFILATEAAHQLLPTIRSRCIGHTMVWPDFDDALAWLQTQMAAPAVTDGPAKSARPSKPPDPADLQTLLIAAGGRPADALAWAQSAPPLEAAKHWQSLPVAMARGDVGALSGFSPGDAVVALQKLCHDALALKMGAVPRFFSAKDIAAATAARPGPAAKENRSPNASIQALSQWAKELATTARTVEHPYNPGLMLEFLVSRAALALSVK
jgi:DNA polymerase III subunit delta'